MMRASNLGLLLAAAIVSAPPAAAQLAPRSAHPPKAAAQPSAPAEKEPAPTGAVRLSAALSPADQQGVKSGIVWRIFNERVEADGKHKLVAESSEAAPTIALPDGAYVVHAAYGLTGATRRVTIEGHTISERVVLNAGGLKLVDVLGEAAIPPQRLSISIYVPERGNSEAKLVLANARGGEIIALPEGSYHIVSTLLDTTQGAQGASNATNSVVTADLRIPAGKLIEATLRHHAATMTLKLVNAPGGEALANTSFSVLTPGGDVIRELIGAFPSAVLAEGEYVAIARHDGKTYQNTFKVQSTKDAEVEIVAKEEAANQTPGPAGPQ
ncbi:hypothetical protein [Methylocystis heyeri]|uniref:Uncharacterized protein n=1 Tax=Methylocystis heyeri TaxID=391905 RepID=A0A6B8KGP2_9HYPH|nr:hypothetical protein [Methylocystis heyeri]QGM47516.1 hypothetical protein H2LOC_018505 [Methylocystis heyeri]